MAAQYSGVIDLEKKIDEARQGEVLDAFDKNTDKKFYIESYGCSMNFSDSEVIASILNKEGFGGTKNFLDADLLLINTCSIRDNAEQRVRARLQQLKKVKETNSNALIGVMGCMAERLKKKLLEEEKIVDLVVGPDAYRELPQLVKTAEDGQKSVNVLLSREETYADISPIRLGGNGITAFISIMRGCDNMCSFCVVPFTRGRERSRDALSIVKEAEDLFNDGYREVTLLGQNVDSYHWEDKESDESINFADLLALVAQVNPKLRVRFSTSHPKDITEQVLDTMIQYDNICKSIHLPVQSGNSRILEKMNRGYTREWYMEKVDLIRKKIPECSLTADVITGFCSETEEEHQDTLSIMEYVKYDFAYMFKYSERPGTHAAKNFEDDVPEDVKSRRLDEIIALQHKQAKAINEHELGKVYEVLVEKASKRSEDELTGRSSQNKLIIFPKGNAKPGDYVNVKITDSTHATLKGEITG